LISAQSPVSIGGLMEHTPVGPYEIVLHRLRKVAATDEQFRRAVKEVAAAVLSDMEHLEREAAPPGDPPALAIEPPAGTEVPGAEPLIETPRHEPDVAEPARVAAPLRLGDSQAIVSVRGTPEGAKAAAEAAEQARRRAQLAAVVAQLGGPEREAGFNGPDPGVIAQRCRLKSEACRWVVERRRALGGPRSGDPAAHERDRAMFTRAKALPSCYLWMMDPRGLPLPPDDAPLERAAGCYEALADAMELSATLGGAPEHAAPYVTVLHLVAEAQSALRVALLAVDDSLADQDQREAFIWLRRETGERGVFVARHMRIDDPADAEAWDDLRRRIAELGQEWQRRQARRKGRQSLLGKARYHAGRAAGGGEAAMDDWVKLAGAIEQLISEGTPPTDPEVRAVLQPVVDEMPELEIGPGLRAVIEEIDRHLAAAGNGEVDNEPRRRAESPEVARVRQWLAGKQIVLIGGIPRPRAQAALEKAFALDGLVWLAGLHHRSFFDFEPAIARPETAVVILAIRWSSHSFGEVRGLCERYGKPLVRLPAGYNPDQVALQIAQQVSDVLSVG
jgi:hypothetical protein